MCGIVGLHLKDPALHAELGSLLAPMLDALSSRGPDSTGIALYGDPLPEGTLRFTVRLPEGRTAAQVATAASQTLGAAVTAEYTYPGGAAFTAAGSVDAITAALLAAEPEIIVVGYGHSVEVFKDVGLPREVSERYDLPSRGGYQGVGHTRLATESAVTPDHSHPFISAPDLAVIHNGAFSNYFTVRKDLEREGIEFLTDNDTEVCARYIAWQMDTGKSLKDALRMVFKELDGFYTLVVTTADEFAVVRDEFSCKPAVIAETDQYVAVASEYHALAELPGITSAKVFEPHPQEIYLWTR